MFIVAALVEAVKRISSYLLIIERLKRNALIKYIFLTPLTPLR